MKGKQKGRPTKWAQASILEFINLGKRAVQFDVWEKWKQKERKLGTLTISVGGLRLWPQDGKRYRQKTGTRWRTGLILHLLTDTKLALTSAHRQPNGLIYPLPTEQAW